MTPLPVRVLLVDDSADDAELVVRTLGAGGFAVEWARVDDAASFTASLDAAPWDVILSDFSMPHFRPQQALAELDRRGLDIPLLVVSGTIDERTAVGLMRAGARDYVIKDNLARLVPAVTRELRGALARHEGRQAHHVLRRSESFFRTVVEHASDVIAVLDLDGRILHVAPSVRRVLGYEAEPLVGRPFVDLIAIDDRARCEQTLRELRDGARARITCEARFPHADGSARVLECVASCFKTPAGDDAIAVNARDVTERREQEHELRETGARLTLLNAIARAARVGATPEEIIRRTLEQLAAAFPGMQAVYTAADAHNFLTVQDVAGADGPRPQGRSVDLSLAPEALEVLLSGRVLAVSDIHADRRLGGLEADAESMHVGASAMAPLTDAGRLRGGLSLASSRPHEWTANEIATLGEVASFLALALNEETAQRERRLAEAALRASEAQLRQAQKMEAIGRLAGGVAHDFNNLLTAILGYGEIVAEQLGDDHPASRDLDQILDAGRRAAGLTRQLLAFSRQQVLEPETFPPNEVVTAMAQLLGRLLGQDIQLELDLGDDDCCITADRGQLEQVLMNLAVNARDSMPDGGRLRIATRAVVLDTAAAAVLQVVPGSHVRIEVADTGSGMDAATVARIFEPFFTTKQKGQGTGLGLATVYGIVTQSGGGVEVESAPGMGTTFRLYFPETHASAAPARVAQAEHPLTVLILEPDAAVRAAARRILARAGHTLLEAPALDMALALGERNAVDVLLVGAGAEESVAALRDALAARLPRLRLASLPPYPFRPETLLERVSGVR